MKTKRKILDINRTGRPSLMAEMTKFFGRPWTLEEATVFLSGSRNLLEENKKLLGLIQQSKNSPVQQSNGDREITSHVPTNDSTTTNTPATVEGTN
jgi:hypothetical protein